MKFSATPEHKERVDLHHQSTQPPPMVVIPNEYDLTRLYKEHAGKVARWAARLGGPSLEPMDVVQEVFEVVHRKLSTLRHGVSPTTWLFAITRNTVLAARRKQRLRNWLSATIPGLMERTSAGPLPTPVESLERREAALELHRLLEALPEQQRTAFVLYELEGMSSEEVATLMGASVATTRLWLHRARAKFLQLTESES
jgi:RNA polymerase sigma-70 factor (ECF subfamily)